MNDEKNPNIAALNKVYQNSRTAIEAIDCLIPKVKNTNMKKDLASQILGHHSLVKSSASKLHESNHYPHEVNFFNKIPLTASLHLKSAVDSSDGHIAEILIENSTSGMIEIQRSLNQCDNLTHEVTEIGGEAIAFEQANINKMRGYL